MATLTQNQINNLKNQGLTDEKIQTLAQQKGYELPKASFLKSVSSSLVKSEKNFGQSIAGAFGSTALSDVKKGIDQTNQLNNRVQTNLINTIKQRRAEGKDTSKLVDALKYIDKEVNFYDILNNETGGSLNKSAKQVFGEGLGVATDIIGFGSLPGKFGQVTKATSLGQGMLQGAKTGALVGGAFGGVGSISGAMQDNKSGGEILGSGIKGGVLGGIAGGVLGGITGGISGSIAGKSTKESKFALDLVSPKPTEKVKIQALREGRITEQGLFRAGAITPSKRDQQLADAVKGFVSSKKSPVQNVDALDSAVSEINSGVKAYVQQNKVPFNTNQLRSRLNAGRDELRLVFASDKTAEKTYRAVVDEFMKHTQNMDTAGLLDARQAFDRIPAIKKLLESQGLGENVKKEIVMTARTKANEYIASLLPKGNAYRSTLLQESRMIEAIGNIAEKNTNTIGTNKIQLYAQKYPWLNWVVGGTATGLILGGGVGVGRSILGSTD